MVGAVSSDVREFEDRQVVWVDVDAGSRVGALTSDSSGKIENASVTARGQRLPADRASCDPAAPTSSRVSPPCTAGGSRRKALTDCSGVVPIIMVVEGPAVSGPALLLGIADFVVMTVDSYAFVTGPDHGGRVHRCADRQRRARRRGVACPLHRRGQPRRCRSRRRPSTWSPSCSPTCRSTTTRSRRGGRPKIRPIVRHPRRRARCRRRRPVATTCAT